MDYLKDAERDCVRQVHLILGGDNDKEMDKLSRYVRKEIGSSTARSRLRCMLVKIGNSEKAEQLYQVPLKKVSSDTEHDN